MKFLDVVNNLFELALKSQALSAMRRTLIKHIRYTGSQDGGRIVCSFDIDHVQLMGGIEVKFRPTPTNNPDSIKTE